MPDGVSLLVTTAAARSRPGTPTTTITRQSIARSITRAPGGIVSHLSHQPINVTTGKYRLGGKQGDHLIPRCEGIVT
jgi:hypothetical protein